MTLKTNMADYPKQTIIIISFSSVSPEDGE